MRRLEGAAGENTAQAIGQCIEAGEMPRKRCEMTSSFPVKMLRFICSLRKVAAK
jgi:hypothetical protein